MKYRRENQHVIVKLDMDEDILVMLKEVTEKENIKNGYILNGIGACRLVEIGYMKGKEYVRDKIENNMEITSFAGTITEGDPSMHIHINVAGEDHVTKGGHFFGGKAHPLMEILILVLDQVKMDRKLNEKSGLKELTFL